MEEKISLPAFFEYKDQAVIDSFKKEKTRLLDFIRKRVADKADAEDILQDVYYQLLESFNPIQPIEKISSWLFRVARNKIVDKYRKKKPVSFTDHSFRTGDQEYSLNLQDLLYDDKNNPEEQHFNSLIWDTIMAALEELPEEQRSVFISNELEGIGFKELSEDSGVSVNTLLSRKRYAVLHLRKRLQKLYDEL